MKTQIYIEHTQPLLRAEIFNIALYLLHTRIFISKEYMCNYFKAILKSSTGGTFKFHWWNLVELGLSERGPLNLVELGLLERVPLVEPRGTWAVRASSTGGTSWNLGW